MPLVTCDVVLSESRYSNSGIIILYDMTIQEWRRAHRIGQVPLFDAIVAVAVGVLSKPYHVLIYCTYCTYCTVT